MPAAVAVPAIISVAGMAANAIGQHKAANAAKKAAAAKKSSLQSVMDFNYGQDVDYQNANKGRLADLYAQASGPQTESTSSSLESTEDSTHSMDFGPEGNAAAADVMTAARNAPWEVNNLLAAQQAAANRDISGQERVANANLNNVAAARGVDSRLLKVGAAQPFNAARLNTDLQTKQQAYANKVGAYGNIANMLKGLFQKDITHTQGTQKGRSTTTGGPNFSAMMGALSAGAPVHKEFADVQGA